MPSADEVRPRKWNAVTVIFDNGWYSIISGTYDGDEALGERWNGEGDDVGYPNTRGYAQWHVVPDFLRVAVLQGALAEIRRKPYSGSNAHKTEIVTLLSRYYLEQ